MPDAKHTNEWASGKIVFIYIIVGCLWIFLSDGIVEWVDNGGNKAGNYQTVKGIFFVLATAAMLYALINRGIQQIQDSETEQRFVRKRYSELVENANDLIYTLDLAGQFTSINRSGEIILGYSREEILQKSIENLVTEKSKPTIQKILKISNVENSTVDELEFIKRNGDKVLLEISTRQIFDGQQAVGIQGIARDITARTIAAESLQLSESRYRNLIETANEGIMIIDAEANITFVNQKICEMLDYDSEELLNSNIADFMNDSFKEYTWTKLEHQKSGFQERFDFKFKKLGGEDVWTSISASPIFKDEVYTGSLGMITDITDRKVAEEAVLKEKGINDSMIESLPGIFYLIDQDGKFLRWNKNFETVSGYSPEEMEEMHPLDFFVGDEKDLLDERISEVFEKGDSSVEANFVSKDKKSTPYFFTGKKMMLGDLECLVGMGIDISKRGKN